MKLSAWHFVSALIRAYWLSQKFLCAYMSETVVISADMIDDLTSTIEFWAISNLSLRGLDRSAAPSKLKLMPAECIACSVVCVCICIHFLVSLFYSLPALRNWSMAEVKLDRNDVTSQSEWRQQFFVFSQTLFLCPVRCTRCRTWIPSKLIWIPCVGAAVSDGAQLHSSQSSEPNAIQHESLYLAFLAVIAFWERRLLSQLADRSLSLPR